MSDDASGDDRPPDPNPYAVTSHVTGVNPRHKQVRQVLVLGILMIIQGSFVALYGVLMAIFTFWIPQTMLAAGSIPNQGVGVSAQQMATYIQFLYAALALVSMSLGVLNIFAGIRVMNFRNRILGIIALSVGVGTILGACYCVPTSIALCVYGIVILLNESVKSAFDLQTQGETPTEIRARFASIR